MECEANEECVDGECGPIDCARSGCEENQICQSPDCVENPCFGVACADGQFCRGGQCVDSCAAISCPLDNRCEDGRCIEDPCYNVSCNEGETCSDGRCVPDCGECPMGQSCVAGECVLDPCSGVERPAGQVCQVDNAGNAQCIGGWEASQRPERDPNQDDDVDNASGESIDVAEPGLGGIANVDNAPSGGNAIAGNGPAADATEEPDAVGCACDANSHDSGTTPFWLLAISLFGLRRRLRRL